jgi:hypothetical protein
MTPSGSAPGRERDPEVGKERPGILAEQPHLDLPAAAGPYEPGAQAVPAKTPGELGALDTVVDSDEDAIAHYAAS